MTAFWSVYRLVCEALMSLRCIALALEKILVEQCVSLNKISVVSYYNLKRICWETIETIKTEGTDNLPFIEEAKMNESGCF